jgi:AraC-like DNA-binding protein
MKLFIKNMVSLRCELVVKTVLDNLGLQYTVLEFGEIEVKEHISKRMHETLKVALMHSELELMEDKKAMLIEKIKMVIIEMVHYTDELPLTNFSDHLSQKLNYDYTYLSNLFSEVKGTTIEKFIILHKIERVKELLIYNELSLTEIAIKLRYSSLAHLSNQFKKTTGLTPSFFKKLKHKRLIVLENV